MSGLPGLGSTPIRARLDLVRGDDYPIAWRWRDKTSQEPINLTDWTVALLLQDSSGIEVLRLDTVGTRLVVDGSAGSITGMITGAETLALPDRGAWQLRLTTPAGIAITKIAGPYVAQRPGASVGAASPGTLRGSDAELVAHNGQIEIWEAAKQGPPGPPGRAGYEHIQAQATDVWIINHNLGRRVACAAYTMGGLPMLGEPLNVSINQLRLVFEAPVDGYAVIP